MKKEPTYIWIIERESTKENRWVPLWLEPTRESARSFVAFEKKEGRKARYRKYVPEQANW
jgi:hypothetical protein